jgi:hypothetical protein
MPRELNSGSAVRANEVRPPPLISSLHAFDHSIAAKTASSRDRSGVGARISKALKIMCKAKSRITWVSACRTTRRK